MSKLSIVIPSRNEQFLSQTVDDVFSKAREEIEVIVVLEGYWPVPILADRPNLILIHRGVPRGLRGAVNDAVAIAKGKYIMKIDAHCLFDEGFDVKLKEDCEYNWISVPRRYSLDAENWCRKKKHPIDYLYVCLPVKENKFEINVKVWNEKNYDAELQKKLIDDIFTFQGSCWFMHRDYFYELELMDEYNYGTFRKEPQEISFKAWLSGGRVIRNKKTWYAHLHKGRQYGRGYSPNRTDFRKGDAYLINWLSDSAWDKQTIPFKWLIDKFEMPNWESFDWSKWVKKEKRIVKLYQNIPLEGVVEQNANRKDSKFWNEGKWENFIAPLLSKNVTDSTFVEMGCNAGLFLKLAEDYGFRNVVGVEKDSTPVSEGLRYRDSIGYHYKMLKRTLGGQFGENGNFNIDELPIADYTIMSTFHYYIDINSWIKYLDRLKSKTRYVLIVSRPRMRRIHWRAYSSYEDLKVYFSDWEEMGIVDGVSSEGDPSPRNLFSVLFKSPVLDRIALTDIDTREPKDNSMYVAMKDIAEQISSDDSIDPLKTEYYEKWLQRKEGRWAKRTINEFVLGKFNMMLDVKENGMKDPIILDQANRICDGGHRLAILEALGYESVIVRRI